VVLDVTGTGVALELTFETRAVRVRPARPHAKPEDAAGTVPDVTISGTPFALLRLAREGRDDPTVAGRVRIVGDMETAQRLARALAQADPDFEELLSRLIGDAAAHQVGRGLRGAYSVVAAGADTVLRDLGEFLSEESRLTPVEAELSSFAAGVDILRDDVARLAKRIERLERGGRNRPT
jgi:ubiquinone biosynthesis accessory factor UbiJ